MSKLQTVSVVMSPDEAAKRINGICNDTVGRVYIAYWEIGGILLDQKSAQGHGSFIPWLESNFEFNRYTAARWMRFHRENPDAKCVSETHFAQIFKMLTAGKKTAHVSAMALNSVAGR